MKNFLLILVLSLSSFFSLTKLNAQSERRDVGTYEGIHIAGSYDVMLTSGSEGSITLEGSSDDLSNIESYVKKGILIIKKKNTSWFNDWKTGKVNITIPVEQISEVILSGSGSIESKIPLKFPRIKALISGSGDIDIEVEAENVNGTVTGSGDLTLKGSADQVTFFLTGSGTIEAEKLIAKEGEAQITGSGNVEMYSSEVLQAKITGSGDLRCYGSPTRQSTKVTGSGDIMIRD